MNNYYFTFGQVHTTRQGKPLRNYWVRVVASDSSIARCIFITLFCIPNLEDVRKWSHQYDEESFNSEYFPEGELRCYRQEALTMTQELIIPNT